MLKRTLFFSTRGHLCVSLDQLVYEMKSDEESQRHTFPIEDLGFVVIENPQITLTGWCLQALASNNTSVIICDKKRMPVATLLPHEGNTLTQKITGSQLQASDALKNRLWRQTVCAKIENQAACLDAGRKPGAKQLRAYQCRVKNGDPENCEAQVAKEYFAFHSNGTFRRSPDGGMPNPALNYGYAILRSATARALVGSGLSCIAGIHHHNQYNAFALADDIMEPCRPFVDDIVLNDTTLFSFEANELNKDMKAALLSVLAVDVYVGGMRRPLMNALTHTSASLARCFLREAQNINFPVFPPPCHPTAH